jgi:hypothetical protein
VSLSSLALTMARRNRRREAIVQWIDRMNLPQSPARSERTQVDGNARLLKHQQQ